MQSYLITLPLSNEVWIPFAFVCALLVSYAVFPSIIYLSQAKGLMDDPNTRSSHAVKTPTLGGVGIFAGIIASMVSYCSVSGHHNFIPVFGALVILFFLGVKDDILILAPRTKFLGQSIAALLVIIATDIRILSFDGILGYGTLEYTTSVLFTYFVFILMINSFNLIDGIDGLAGSIALMFALFSGCYFYLVSSTFLATLSFALVGTLVAFLFFNFSDRRKIFMGDTGSMIIGFLMTYLAVSLLSHSTTTSSQHQLVSNMPVYIITLFSYPLLDTFRIFLIRVLILKKSPFLADKHHIHHRLLNLGLKHWQATILVSTSTGLLFIANFYLASLEINVHLSIAITIGAIIYAAPFALQKIVQKQDTFIINR